MLAPMPSLRLLPLRLKHLLLCCSMSENMGLYWGSTISLQPPATCSSSPWGLHLLGGGGGLQEGCLHPTYVGVCAELASSHSADSTEPSQGQSLLPHTGLRSPNPALCPRVSAPPQQLGCPAQLCQARNPSVCLLALPVP